jgi:hypothetical protein
VGGSEGLSFPDEISGCYRSIALDGEVHVAEMDDGVAAPVFFDDLGDRSGKEGGAMSGPRHLARLIPSSPHGAGGGGAEIFGLLLGAGR